MTLTQEPVSLKPRIEEFLTFCGARNLSRNTIRAYRADLSEFAALVGSELTVAEINRKLVRSYLVKLHERGAVHSSVVRKLAAIRSFCRRLENEGLLDAALIESLNLRQRRGGLPNVPSEPDLKRLLDGDIPGRCPQRDRVILELLYSAGLRASEVVGINLNDFRDEDVLLVRGKGRKERFVVLGEYAQLAIKEWLPMRQQLLAKMSLQTDALLFSVGPFVRLNASTCGV